MDKKFGQLEHIQASVNTITTLMNSVNQRSPHSSPRLETLVEIAVLESEIISQRSNNKYVFINGDLNGRSSQLPDFTLIDSFVSDLFDFDDSTASFFDKTSLLENMNIPLDRASKDHKTNTLGYWLIDTCKNNNLFIVN